MTNFHEDKLLKVAAPIMAALITSPNANKNASLEQYANDAIYCATLLIDISTKMKTTQINERYPDSYL